MVRAACVDKNGVRKGAWSEEEDTKLRAHVLRHGHSNWRLVPKYAGLNRCGKSCRLRWMNYLQPGVKRGDYTQQEADLIHKLHNQFGNKWSAIAARLPGRTDNDIKNYWHTHLHTKRTSSSAKTSSAPPQHQINTGRSTRYYPNISDQMLSFSSQELSLPPSARVYILESSSSSSNYSGLSAADPPDPFTSIDDAACSSSDSIMSAGFLEDSFWNIDQSFGLDTSYVQELDLSDFSDAFFAHCCDFFGDDAINLL